MDNRLYWLWLAGVLGFASPQAGTLLDLYGGAENLWQARDSEDFSTLLGAKQRRRMEMLAPEQFAPQLEACDKLAVGSRCGFCKACFSGEYPVEPPKAGRKLKFETRLSEKE